jgi:hypothetical protein
MLAIGCVVTKSCSHFTETITTERLRTLPTATSPWLRALARRRPKQLRNNCVPLFRELLVSKGFDENTTHHRASLEVKRNPGLGVIPVA